MHEEGAEALSRRALELDVDGFVGQTSLAVLGSHGARKHGAHRAVGVANGILKRHFLLVVDGLGSGEQDALVLHAVDVMTLLGDVVQGSIAGHAVQHGTEVE